MSFNPDPLLQLSKENLKESFDKSGEILSEAETEVASSTPIVSMKNKSFARKSWEWIGLHDQTLVDLVKIFASIAIPVLLFCLSKQQSDTALDNQRHEIMANYLDKMTALMEKDLNNSKNLIQRQIAKAITLNAVRQLDGERRGQVLKVLYESDLIGGQCKSDPKSLTVVKDSCKEALIKLDDAKLDGMSFQRPIPLTGVDLQGAILSKAVLPSIDLTSADMQGAKLTGANLTKAILIDAKLQDSKMIDADLRGAFLSGSNLTNTLLQNADLRGADLSNATLKDVKLKDAKYNDTDIVFMHEGEQVELKATIFPAGFVPSQNGMQVVNTMNLMDQS
jgi:uncharacterized protein YjbI with pentapeptide repeats